MKNLSFYVSSMQRQLGQRLAILERVAVFAEMWRISRCDIFALSSMSISLCCCGGTTNAVALRSSRRPHVVTK